MGSSRTLAEGKSLKGISAGRGRNRLTPVRPLPRGKRFGGRARPRGSCRRPPRLRGGGVAVV